MAAQGKSQFLTNRQELLNQFDTARTKAQGHVVQTGHGVAFEAALRSWLESFLPKRIGVASGYIVSRTKTDADKLPHFDVILYDQMETPTLWIEDGSKSRALPAEFVLGVLEVKSSLNSTTAKDAMAKLLELAPLMGDERPGERYPQFLPEGFFCACVFAEVRAADASPDALDHLVPPPELRGAFVGGVVLRREGQDGTGRLWLINSDQSNTLGRDLIKGCMGSARAWGSVSSRAMLMWGDSFFPMFAFDILALLNGTYDPGKVSSMYFLDLATADG